ncbi:MAG: tetratricopeptide repeat protein [Methylococcales bacterium]|nr:tetratricopeptide repeat protein [Methylococcales bacterium]
MNPTDPTLNLYNPAAQDPEQLLAHFIDRKNMLAQILAIVRNNTPDRPQQHLMLIGPRGMGKTTLLCAIKHSIIADPDLSQHWLPLLFQEEQYGIGDLADFWLEAIRHLQGTNQTVDQLLANPAADFATQAQAMFFELLAATGKRAVLLADNLNDIFDTINDDLSLHRLRALWMTDPRMMVIGAAPSYFAEITEVDQVFHDFFRSFALDRLNAAELDDFLTKFAQMHNDTAVLEVIKNAPERVAALRILTGGNPRLVKLGYRVLRDGLGGDLRQDLERLLDETTPFFKHRIDSLSKEARRTFDAIARRWDPVCVDDIRVELRKPSNNISVQIKRLMDEGFVEEAYSPSRKKSYQVSERFYNVYYLMRHSREGRQRLRWLVGFMQTFYSSKDYQHWAKRLGNELAQPLDGHTRRDTLAHLQALGAAADDDGRAAVFDTLVRDAVAHDDRQALDEELRVGAPVERYGCRYYVVALLWLLAKPQRQALGFKPGNSEWWQRLRKALETHGLLGLAEQTLIEIGWELRETAAEAGAAGVVLEWFFNDYEAAEAAYRQAVAIKPDDVATWNNLGTALSDLRRYPEAETAYRKALELDPEDVIAWYNLGNALNNQNRYPEAEAAYRKALELDPEYVYAWNGLGLMLNNQSRYPEAEAAYRKALELDPEYVNAWNNLGRGLNNQNRYPEAETACRKALELDPEHDYAWNNLGNALKGQRRYPEAEAAYLKALALNPEYYYALGNLAGLYLMDMNRREDGIRTLINALQVNPDYGYARYVLRVHWQAALAPAAAGILANSAGADNLRTAITETLIEKAANGAKDTVLAALLALDAPSQAIFEPLLLALQALTDRSVLYRLAREKQELVQDVMARLG